MSLPSHSDSDGARMSGSAGPRADDIAANWLRFAQAHPTGQSGREGRQSRPGHSARGVATLVLQLPRSPKKQLAPPKSRGDEDRRRAFTPPPPPRREGGRSPARRGGGAAIRTNAAEHAPARREVDGLAPALGRSARDPESWCCNLPAGAAASASWLCPAEQAAEAIPQRLGSGGHCPGRGSTPSEKQGRRLLVGRPHPPLSFPLGPRRWPPQKSRSSSSRACPPRAA